MAWVLIVLCFIGGAALAFQAGVNGEIGSKIGSLQAAFIAYFVGTVCLFVSALAQGGLTFSWPSFSFWKWTVGALGAFYIVCIILAVPRIGASAAITAGIAGQLLLGMLLDHFGAFGTPEIPVDASRLAAVGLIGVALYLFYH
ncbi:DMT family transporter [uncultured Marinococcus sp.]|uniref:DMT family transporter n=1 Tax=uncultured Marinococcus sp. TaxID=487012 RepID=UPI00262BC80B|nr:DMT family transporter [uncultured Marinococcus sp.]